MNRALKVLIVDDERLARHHLRRLIDSLPGVECVGECPNGTAALASLAATSPDVMLLDVEMPGMDGFQVVRSIPANRMPAIIFVTAHDHYAVKAFDVSATDYLLKPPDPGRLERALESAAVRLQSRTFASEQARLRAMLEAMKPASGFEIVVRERGRTLKIAARDVEWLRAEDNYVRVYSRGRSYLIRRTIAGLEKELDSQRFVRIHRSVVANIDCVRELRHSLAGRHSIVLASGEVLPVSRAYRKRVAGLFQGRSPQNASNSPHPV